MWSGTTAHFEPAAQGIVLCVYRVLPCTVVYCCVVLGLLYRSTVQQYCCMPTGGTFSGFLGYSSTRAGGVGGMFGLR